MPVPYIHFDTDCREAMTFYQAVFGGELEIMGYDQMPDAPTEMAQSSNVMHATLTTDKGPLFASDAFPGTSNAPQASVSISWDVADAAEGKALFEKLMSEGGEIVMPFEATFFASGFGMGKDRFGTHWMIMTGAEAE
ncbi:VOC family protein [Actibacterium pelagium]|uniref:VOC family protein n=1 Tax=Actibacterium pelagium TaxID=2029103 RepID=A0A917EGY6_9RHOB|nr:VOC family protein [Actibacterium pelagium]GGE39997.1 VOC family protein [Actibacterium pelagium]